MLLNCLVFENEAFNYHCLAMHVLILGLGISGKAALEFCQKRGDVVSVYDDKLAPDPVDLEKIELVVKSPGISLDHPLVEEIQNAHIPIIGEIDLALSELKNKTVYGITGSNGKTTTTLLATHLLKTAGKKAIAVGNIGTPLLSAIQEDADCFVVEFSSFQLETIRAQPVLDGAVLLNLTPNHLDRHPSFEAYAAAKLRIKELLKEGAPFYSGPFDMVPIEGYYRHDLENIAAASALTGIDPTEGLKTFVKPPHRLEFVRNFKNIAFVNDSKATSVDAVLKAVEALPKSVVLIVGGVDKGGEYSIWLPLFREKVRKVFTIGEAAERIEKTLAPRIPVERAGSLEVAVKKAAQFAQSSETVLLSPGCSSYDQFKNYEERGKRFKEIVSTLEEILS